MNMMCIICASRTHGVMNVGMHAHGWRHSDTKIRASTGGRAHVNQSKNEKAARGVANDVSFAGLLFRSSAWSVPYLPVGLPGAEARVSVTSTGLKHAFPWDSGARHTAYKPYPKCRKGTSRHHANDAPGSTEIGQRERKHNTGN